MTQKLFRYLYLFLFLVIVYTAPVSSCFAQAKYIFVSDTQEPLWVEKLFLKTNNNSQATDAIFKSILSTNNVDEVFHLGDLTALGSLNWEWKKIDKFTMELKKAGVPFNPLMGNHEYFIFAKGGKKEFAKRFSLEKTKWYSVKKEGNVVILLNSNFAKLTKEEINQQQKWYSAQIKLYDNDLAIKSVIVCEHHAPYTNSKVVTPSEEAQRQFVPAFLKSAKCKLFISGHAHAFEHFKIKNKDFLVIGGGGGALQPLLTKQEQRFKDLYVHKSDVSFFHYIECSVAADKINIVVKKLNDDIKTFSDEYSFEIKNK